MLLNLAFHKWALNIESNGIRSHLGRFFLKNKWTYNVGQISYSIDDAFVADRLQYAPIRKDFLQSAQEVVERLNVKTRVVRVSVQCL